MGSPIAAIIDLDEHINDNRQPYIIAASAICLSAAYIAVTLRFLARRLARNSLEADDYTVLLALFFTSVFATTTLIGVHYGLGKPWILVTNKTVYIKVVLVLACTCETSFWRLSINSILLLPRYYTTLQLQPPSLRFCYSIDVSSPFEASSLFSGVLGLLL